MTYQIVRAPHPPRPKPCGPEHPADEACKSELLSVAVVFETHRVPGLLRLVTEFGRRAFDRGRNYDAASVARAVKESLLRQLADDIEIISAWVPVTTDSLPRSVVVDLRGDGKFCCKLVAVHETGEAEYEVETGA